MFQFACRPGELILHAGLREGIPLAYDCSTGTCGTCKATLLEGEIEDLWSKAPGRRFLKADGGEFLMCQCRALTDCVIAVSTLDPSPNSLCPGYRKGTIIGRRFFTSDVVFVEVELDRPLAFEAGHFVLLQVPGIQGFRAYSMANFDYESERLQFIVKKKPSGLVTGWLFGPGVEGTVINLFGPLGHAIFTPDLKKDLLLIAGGSGLAPILSILYRGDRDRYFESYRGYLLFGVRTAEDVFLLDELARFKSRFPDSLEVIVAFSHQEKVPGSLQRAYPEFTFTTGFIHEVMALQMKGKFGPHLLAYIAGPPPMVQATKRVLVIEGKLSPTHIRYDEFS